MEKCYKFFAAASFCFMLVAAIACCIEDNPLKGIVFAIFYLGNMIMLHGIMREM